MNHSGFAVFLHFVWATKYRLPTIDADIEKDIHRILCAEAQKMGCVVTAVNGTEDHLHVLINLVKPVDLARLVNQMKGVSAHHINRDRQSENDGGRFRWQIGYGVCSVSPNHLPRVVAYINNQKAHHANDATHVAWEPQGD